MTDLLHLLSGLHHAITQLGELHISISAIDGHDGMVDHDTATIYLSPGLDMVTALTLLSDGITALMPEAPAGRQVAVGGEDIGEGLPAVLPERHLRAVR